ncbi:MAG: GNAT family N-acetyltransferase [Clostridium sp.]
MDYNIRECKREELSLIDNGIVEYNLSKVPLRQKEEFISINRVIENENGEVIAGITSVLYCWNCLYIDILWVKDGYRNLGLGRKLIREVEGIAKGKGGYLVHLDTFDFQAKDFYVKEGYEVFGVLDECPQEHKRYFMKKLI